MEETNVAIGTIDKLADKIGAVAAKYGPQAADLALEVGRIGAIQHLLQSSLQVVLGILIFCYVSRPLWKKTSAETERRKDARNDDGLWAALLGMGAIVSGLVSFFVAGDGVGGLSNLYAWTGLSRPEVFLAATALGL